MKTESNNESLTIGQRLADKCSSIIGSWAFIGFQSTFLLFWIILNVLSPKKPDPYPFILLNLMLSFQAAYTGPVLLMAANRQSEIDRKRSIEDLELGIKDNEDLFLLREHIDNQVDMILKKLEEIERNNNK